jgi:CP family cyanate transporter-like MFS transporter
VSYTIASFGPTVMGALRDLTGSFQAIWMSMAFLTVVQVVLATRMKPGLAKVP